MSKLQRIAAYIGACIIFLTSCGQSVPTWQEQYDLGIRYLSEGNYEEAIIAFTAAIEIDPKQALVYVGRGDAYILSGETEENQVMAQADYEQAIKLDEMLFDAYIGLANIRIYQENYDKALGILQMGLDKTLNNTDILSKISEIENNINNANLLEKGATDNTSVRTTASEVVVNIPDLQPQILYYNDLGQVVACINFYMNSDTGDTFYEWPELVIFEYDADGHLKSSECTHLLDYYGTPVTLFDPSDGHLDYVYTGAGIEARTINGEIWWIRDSQGLLTEFPYWGTNYSYSYNVSGNVSQWRSSSGDEYMVTYNTAHQIISGSLTNSGLSLPASFAYNNNGQLISATTPFYEAIPLSFSYDASGELSAIQGGIGEWGYDFFPTTRFRPNVWEIICC